MHCVFRTGARSEIYGALRIRRDDPGNTIAIAARNGYRALTAMPVIPGDRSGVAIPMIDRTGLQAVIYVASRTADISSSCDALVELVNDACAPYVLAIERERDRASALYDGLTGLLTPRAFRNRFHEEIQRANVRVGSDLSVWFIDTDEFKQVNDTLGHGTGDRVLQQMATILRAHAIPEIDLAARNGGDEFCMLARGTPKTRAIERAYAFCSAVRSHDFGIGQPLSASIGVAAYPYDGTTSSALLELADGAMYHSKRSGRNRVSFALESGCFQVYSQ